jgi:hypothetical protein
MRGSACPTQGTPSWPDTAFYVLKCPISKSLGHGASLARPLQKWGAKLSQEEPCRNGPFLRRCWPSLWCCRLRRPMGSFPLLSPSTWASSTGSVSGWLLRTGGPTPFSAPDSISVSVYPSASIWESAVIVIIAMCPGGTPIGITMTLTTGPPAAGIAGALGTWVTTPTTPTGGGTMIPGGGVEVGSTSPLAWDGTTTGDRPSSTLGGGTPGTLPAGVPSGSMTQAGGTTMIPGTCHQATPGWPMWCRPKG